jgi:LysM repeat protein
MKNLPKLFGITVLLAVIGFSALFVGACKSEPPPQPPPPPAAPPLPPPAPPAILEEYHDAYLRHHNDIILNQSQSYTVQKDETLVIIARRFYKDGSIYPLIFGASDEVADPDRIEVGTVLTIPDLELNWNDAKAKKSIDELILEIAEIEEHRGRKETAEMLRNHTK